jgi:hypothetical protein
MGRVGDWQRRFAGPTAEPAREKSCVASTDRVRRRDFSLGCLAARGLNQESAVHGAARFADLLAEHLARSRLRLLRCASAAEISGALELLSEVWCAASMSHALVDSRRWH